jgi:hypothetical protein
MCNGKESINFLNKVQDTEPRPRRFIDAKESINSSTQTFAEWAHRTIYMLGKTE